MVSGQWFGSSTVSLACIISMCSVQRFPGSHSLRLAFGSFCSPILPTLYSSTVNQCGRCLVPLAGGSWLEGAGLPAMGV